MWERQILPAAKKMPEGLIQKFHMEKTGLFVPSFAVEERRRTGGTGADSTLTISWRLLYSRQDSKVPTGSA